MSRLQFPISSEQLELLIEFGKCNSLSTLADIFGKDPSVISRNLQRLAEDAPVITKANGRWQITQLGKELSANAEKVSLRNKFGHAFAKSHEMRNLLFPKNSLDGDQCAKCIARYKPWSSK